MEGVKAELRRLVDSISVSVGGCEEAEESYEKAARLVLKLRDLKFGEKKERERCFENVPEHFLCPISNEIMRDPVVLSTGETYDRPFIQDWLNSGNRTCPKTQQVLSNLSLTPNHLVKTLISDWCSKNNLSLSCPQNPNSDLDLDLVTKNDRSTFKTLLNDISSPVSPIINKKQAVKNLRLLTKRNKSFRAVIGESPGAISQFLSVLSVPALKDEPQVLEDTVTTILNLSIHDSNKKILGDHSEIIPILITGLKSKNMESRGNSAAALFSLSALDSNKVKIGDQNVIKHLIDLLEEGCLEAKKDAASALFNLCMIRQNKEKAIRDGIISVCLKEIEERTLVDESLALLALLCNDQEAAEEIGELNGVKILMKIARENLCKRNKENSVVVLFSICMYDRVRLRELGEDERLNGTIGWIAQNGTSRARRKASGILERLKRNMPNIHHSC
ncbi:hypothetical protein LUZ60_004796 [Juncus effusus]|nr:hypothetical protein LUZ60_004796 [Juncus effusus]